MKSVISVFYTTFEKKLLQSFENTCVTEHQSSEMLCLKNMSNMTNFSLFCVSQGFFLL